MQIPEGTYYNPYFLSAASLAMPPPLTDGQVPYTDGTPDRPSTSTPATSRRS